MKKAIITLLVALHLFPAVSCADDDEAAARLREERLNDRLEQTLGENWRARVAAYEDYYLGVSCEDGALFAITSDGGQNVLHVALFEEGKLVSHIENPNAVRQDEVPAFAFEIENEIGFAYPSGDWQTFALDRDGRWLLSFYRAEDGEAHALDVGLKGGGRVWYAEYADGVETASGELASAPPFALDLAQVDVSALPRDVRALLAHLDASPAGDAPR